MFFMFLKILAMIMEEEGAQPTCPLATIRLSSSRSLKMSTNYRQRGRENSRNDVADKDENGNNANDKDKNGKGDEEPGDPRLLGLVMA